MPPKNTRIYSAIAPIYNEIMKDVDYEDWADFVDEIIQEHRPEAVTLLELACGTGQIAMFLEELECYKITATDLSEEMLEIGQRIADFRQMTITWKQQDFFDITLEQQYDAVLALFDSVNYIRKDEQMLQFFENVAKVMHQDSVFIFDFTTPQHSEVVAEKLNDEGITTDNYRFERRSFYIPTERTHVNEFEIEKLDTSRENILYRDREVHRQRIYTFAEMKALIARSGLEIEAAYEDFDLVDATDESERITMVLKCPKKP